MTVGGLVAGSSRGSNRTTSSDSPAVRLTPMMPHELQELCWQTATTIRLRTAGRSLLLPMRRAISARLLSLWASDGAALVRRSNAAVLPSPLVLAFMAADRNAA